MLLAPRGIHTKGQFYINPILQEAVMPKYLETAEELRSEVNQFLRIVESYMVDAGLPSDSVQGALTEAAVHMGRIVNLAVRCSPRAVQHTVRKNIVQKAVRDYCRVGMEEVVDSETGRTFHKIDISPKSK